MNDEQIRVLLQNMWIYTHGLETFIYTHPENITDDFVEKYLYKIGHILINWEKSQISKE